MNEIPQLKQISAFQDPLLPLPHLHSPKLAMVTWPAFQIPACICAMEYAFAISLQIVPSLRLTCL